MKKNKLILLLEKHIKGRVLISFLAISLMSITAMTAISNSNKSNNLSLNRTTFAQLNSSSVDTIAHITNVSTTVNLRSKATTNSSILARLRNNKTVTILEKQGDWYKVDANGVVGYIYEEYIALSNANSNETSNLQVRIAAYITNVSTAVNLRARATTSSSVLAKLKNNTAITILEKQGDWYKVDANGTYGYIYKEYITIPSSSNDIVHNNTTDSKSQNISSNITSGTGVIVGHRANLHLSPSSDSYIKVYHMPVGTNIRILGEQGDYLHILYNGTTGYVYRNWVDIN